MPDVNYVGDISFVVSELDAVSLTWAIVPGNNAWNVRHGLNYGETQSSVSDASSGKATLGHPVDVHFQSSSTEGWPCIVMELWDRSFQEVKGFGGIGAAWLPAKPGHHVLPVHMWKPVAQGLEGLRESFVPSFPNIYDLREMVMNPHIRSQYETETVATVYVDLYCVVSGFDSYGVVFTEPINNTIRNA